MATGQQWENYFKRVSKVKQLKLKNALKVLEEDKKMKKEWEGTGLFRMKWMMFKA